MSAAPERREGVATAQDVMPLFVLSFLGKSVLRYHFCTSNG